PRPGALEADGARSPAASAPPPLSLALWPAEAARRRTPWRVPRQGRWRGAAARVVEGCRGERGGRARRRGWWRGAAASPEPGRGGEDGGGVPRRVRWRDRKS